jgi:hypothetical protein
VVMKLHQPVLFVGLGGTGCLIGAELERRLRDDLCGPDGSDLIRLRQNASLQRYQLPASLQFIYADVNQAELDRLPLRAVPGDDHVSVVPLNARYVRDLVPTMNTYPEVAAHLRLMAARYVESWLPSAQGEPRVAPLSRGAGQLPTVGRAALFETIRQGLDVVTQDLVAAVGALANSGEDLKVLGGQPPRAVDVFVAFSVAGGTGAGVFYDYLHLIGEVLRRSGMRAKIYPLVVMPSAFPLGMGGGRPAQLNSGRALLDLFRLVDYQNNGDVNRNLSGYDPQSRAGEANEEQPCVEYPGMPPVVMPPSTVQTAFLFSLPLGADRSDLHRSIVSLVLSLIGTELAQGSENGQHQSFADSFINAGVEREVPAANGIGNRGVSTAQVASLTVPIDDLADLVAGRLMGAAVEEMSSPLGGSPEENRRPIEEFFARAGIQAALNRAGVPFAEPEPVIGAAAIAVALNDRTESMRSALRHLQTRLEHEMPQMLAGFDPRNALLGLLGSHDPFRVHRVLFGHPKLPRESERLGATGLMQRLRQTPPAPPGLSVAAPPSPPLKDRVGLRRLRWNDRQPQDAREVQDAWYHWRTRVAWAQAWNEHGRVWARPMDQLQLWLTRFTNALLEHTQADLDRFRSRAEDLARPRVGVSHLLPLGGGDIEQFHERVVNAMIEDQSDRGLLRPAATAAELLASLIGGERWRSAYQASVDGVPARAVAALREQVKEEIRRFLQSTGPRGITMLPPMTVRLAQAAGVADGPSDEADVQEFRGKLAGLVPAGFAPQGNGRMKVLITYPFSGKNEQIEQYLKNTLNLPIGPGIEPEWRAIEAESLSVVMFRYGMGVTEVEEVREVLRTWAQSLSDERPEDFLKWRQRTGYDFGYLATREEHRVAILHRLLNALWNGRVRVIDGEERSPRRIAFALDGDITLQLPLHGLDGASSWGNLLRAYETGALEDDSDLRRSFCSQLMQELPDGLTSDVRPPHPLYLTVVGLAEEQAVLLDQIISEIPAPTRPRAEQLRRFWTQTLPAAQQLPFSRSDAVRANLASLAGSRRFGSQP